jgi:hypothetical protein
MRRTTCWATALALGASLLAPSSLQARPAHRRALADYLGPLLAKKLNDCTTCHLPPPPGKAAAEDEKPHNAFGARLKAVRKELRKAGKSTDIIARLEAIANEDSDGDGVPNLLELLAGSNPGDATDRPDAAGLAKAKEALAAFLKSRRGYPWRPFEVVQRPPVPRVANAGWVRNPIDAFLAAEHERHGLRPRPEAPRHVLLRRVYLDLIGLPPTRDELRAFRADTSPRAYEKVVDRLLASPQHGERWGRHWMDVWRYSDWAGYGPQVRDSQPHIWHWRDWIIESLNNDKGYDRMVLEMLAGDELAPEDPDALRATGYLVRNFKLLSREKWLQDTVEHTYMAFQAVTIGCARCHDHMFDPILQTDYYQARAIFEPHKVRTDRLPGQPDTKKDGLPRAYDADLDTPTYFFIRGDDRTPDKNRKMAPGVPEALSGTFAVEPVHLRPRAYRPERRDFVIREDREVMQAALTKARSAAEAARNEVATAVTRWAPLEQTLGAWALADLDEDVARSRLRALQAVLRAEELEDAGRRGSEAWKAAATAALRAQRAAALLEARRKHLAAHQARLALGSSKSEDKAQAARFKAAEKVLAAAAKALAKAEADAKAPLTTAYTPRGGKSYPATSTGRRLALARWLASKDNPRTARVAVNHIWLRHFGQTLVPSVFDFGRNGQPPTHPALLDWLAAEFMERGWSMKALHRLIVISSAYRMDSTPEAGNLAADRDNRYLWRMAPRRVEAEVVRDSLFYVAGKLDLTMGGPDLNHIEGLTVARRSLYFRHAAEKQMEFLQLFDAASVSECYERKHSIIPQQALALANSELARRHARLLARDLAAKVGADPSVFVTAAFEQVLSRTPTPAELAECSNFLREQARRYRQGKLKGPAAGDNAGRVPSHDPVLRARESLVHVLLNHHEFVTVR